MRGDRRKPKARGGAEAGPWAGQSSTDSGGNANFQDQKTKSKRSAQTPHPSAVCAVHTPVVRHTPRAHTPSLTESRSPEPLDHEPVGL